MTSLRKTGPIQAHHFDDGEKELLVQQESSSVLVPSSPSKSSRLQCHQYSKNNRKRFGIMIGWAVAIIGGYIYVVNTDFWVFLHPLAGSSITKTSSTSMVLRQQPNSTTTIGGIEDNNINNNNNNKHTILIYGHVHMPHTNGTFINQRLALDYERVCASRGGYSYDIDNTLQHKKKHTDLISRVYSDEYHRGRVPFHVMDEIGFENCDYISVSASPSTSSEDTKLNWTVWDDIFAKLSKEHDSYKFQLELHVPCPDISFDNDNDNDDDDNSKDPLLEYVVSLCRHAGYDFPCQEHDGGNDGDDNDQWWKKDLAERCGMELIQRQFSMQLLQNRHDDRQVLCVPPQHNNNNDDDDDDDDSYYVNEYMSRRLQRKRFPSRSEMQQPPGQEDDADTFVADEGSSSCRVSLGSNHRSDFAKRVRRHLIETYDYFQYCESCQKGSVPAVNNNDVSTAAKVGGTNGNVDNNNNNDPLIVYGHLHMGKTAGTDLNGRLASQFERVCGNKGYSYDSHQTNLDYAKIPLEMRSDNHYKHDLIATYSYLKELKKHGGATKTKQMTAMDKKNVTSVAGWPAHHRARVPDTIMREIGFRDCDYISNEAPWNFWNDMVQRNFGPSRKTKKSINKKNKDSSNDDDGGDQVEDSDSDDDEEGAKLQKQQPVIFELHVPCRNNILDHAMSHCNHFGYLSKFECDRDGDWKRALGEGCFLDSALFEGRFNARLLEESRVPGRYTQRVHCFQPIPLQPYLDYMGRDGRLQRRRIEMEYVHRETNPPRNKAHECIFWENNTDFANEVREHLLNTYDYFKYCDECVGSENELKLVP